MLRQFLGNGQGTANMAAGIPHHPITLSDPCTTYLLPTRNTSAVYTKIRFQVNAFTDPETENHDGDPPVNLHRDPPGKMAKQQPLTIVNYWTSHI